MTRRRKALWAVLLLLTASIVAGYASFPVVMRKLLTGPKLRVLINARPQDFFIDWEEASSPHFGHVVIRNLTLRGSDPNVQWFARIEKIEFEYSLLALLRRSFQAQDVRGSGLSFALRAKLPPGSTVADAALLPPIPGFSDPPLKSPDDHFFVEPKPWVVDLRNVSIDRFEDIWVNQLRYQGPAGVQGGLFLRPLQQVRIEAAAISFGGGQLRIGGSPDGLGLSGSIVVSSRAFEPLRVPMPELPGVLTADLKLDVRADKLQTVAKLVSLPAGAKIEGGSTTGAIRVVAKEGVADGKVTLAVKSGAVRTKDYRLRGDASVDLPVRQWKLSSNSFDVSGLHVALTDIYSTGENPTRGWWGTLDVPSGRVGKTTSAKAAIRCRDARPLLAVLGVKLPGWTSGLMELENFSATANLAAAPETLSVSDLDATGGTFHILGQFAQKSGAARGAFLIQSGLLILGIEVVPPKPAKVRLLLARQWYEKQSNPAGAAGK